MRRSALVLATVLVGMVLLPAASLPGSSGTSATVKSPGNEQTVTGPVGVEVWVTRGYTDSVDEVVVRLSGDGNDSFSSARLSCTQDCGPTSANQRWGGVTFDPRTPFGRPGPIRNGAWFVQANVNRGPFLPDRDARIYVSLPPSPAGNVIATSQGLDVHLAWSKAPELDISAYRIERSINNGPWESRTALGPDATRYDERAGGSGSYSYRVVTVRPKGTPGGGELTATSNATTTPVTAPTQGGSPQNPPPENAQPGGGAGNGTTAGEGGSTSGGSAGGNGAAPPGGGPVPGGGSPGPSGGSDSAARPPGTRIAAPPRASRSNGFGLRSLARLFGYQTPPPETAPDVASEDEGEYGEGQAFSPELDYGGVDPVTGERIEVPRRDRRPIDQLQEVLLRQLDSRSLLTSIAGGLLFLLLGFHVLRWMRATVPAAGSHRLMAARRATATTGLQPTLAAAPHVVRKAQSPQPAGTIDLEADAIWPNGDGATLPTSSPHTLVEQAEPLVARPASHDAEAARRARRQDAWARAMAPLRPRSSRATMGRSPEAGRGGAASTQMVMTRPTRARDRNGDS